MQREKIEGRSLIRSDAVGQVTTTKNYRPSSRCISDGGEAKKTGNNKVQSQSESKKNFGREIIDTRTLELPDECIR